MARCDWCGEELPAGCRSLEGEDPHCAIPTAQRRRDLPWRVGLAVLEELADRRSIKNAIAECDTEVRAEIVESIGQRAVEAVARDLEKVREMLGFPPDATPKT